MPFLPLAVPADAAVYVSAQANNAAALKANLDTAIAAFIAANPNASVGDILLSGAGAGNVFQADVLSVAAGGGELATVQIIAAEGPSAAQAAANFVAVINALGAGFEIVAHDSAVAGNGAVYMLIAIVSPVA